MQIDGQAIPCDKQECSVSMPKGDFVEILPNFKDEEDDEFRGLTHDDEEKGRVTIAALGTYLLVTPTCVVHARWVKLVVC